MPSRFEKLKEMESSGDSATPEITGSEDQGLVEPTEASQDEDDNIFQDMAIDDAFENFGESQEKIPEEPDIEIDFEIPEDPGTSTEFHLEGETEAPQRQKSAEEADSADFPLVEQTDDSENMEVPDVSAGHPETVPEEPDQQAESSSEPAGEADSSDFITNDMFSDLLEEVSTLSDQEIAKESFEDHFSLGTAYRDMDLVDEAIKEFQTALRITEHSKDTKKLIQCCGMLSTCFLKKNMPRSALRWCQTGLDVKDISQQEALAFRYDMGVSYTMEGNQERALQCFDQVFAIDPGYRDVALKIDELKSGRA